MVYAWRVVRVVTHARYRVYVYPEEGGQHNLPHCHVYWADGSCVVGIETLHVLAGDVDRQAVLLVSEYQEHILAAWQRLNPNEDTP